MRPSRPALKTEGLGEAGPGQFLQLGLFTEFELADHLFQRPGHLGDA
jgi:hypothetical protein